ARLTKNQARSATDCSRPRRRDGLINRRAAPQVQGRVSMASYSRNVTYDPRCVLDARTNSEWIPLGRTAGRMGGATNHAAEEGYRVARNGRISARNSAPGVGTSSQDEKRPVGTCCPDWPCECRGDWIRTSDLLNPIQGEDVPNAPQGQELAES